ncbi:DsrE family protein [Alteromonas halophila]|uniref:Sulfurtransferase complex subunit TusC n=1 Tax=Alteromonas halophila TaxID=516698 RepID=A0A918JQF4_9ALTE|nr:DsrE family protein [Alteromonas halophila]GGW97449.1 hypothetical protein GCM10007391_34430 [Alteromonas halophila]
MKRILVILTTPPYGSGDAQDALDFAVAGVNFGHDIVVLFEGDGVWQLTPEQAPPKGIKNVGKRIKSLPLFDVEEIYACKSSVVTRMDSAVLPAFVTPLTEAEKAGLLEAASMVVRF